MNSSLNNGIMCTANTNENKMYIEQITTQKQCKKIKQDFQIKDNVKYILNINIFNK